MGKLLTVSQVSERINYSVPSVYRMLRSGRIPYGEGYVRLSGKGYRIKSEYIDKMISGEVDLQAVKTGKPNI